MTADKASADNMALSVLSVLCYGLTAWYKAVSLSIFTDCLYSRIFSFPN